MKKLLLVVALLATASKAHAFSAEKSVNVVPSCVEVSTTTRISVSNLSGTVMYLTSTFAGMRSMSIQNLDATANLWCNYAACVVADPTKPCVGFKAPPNAILVFPLTPVSDNSKSPNFGTPYCVNDGGGFTNAVVSLCR